MAGIMNKILPMGTLTRTPNMVYGNYKGYYLTVQYLNMGYFIRINYKLAENMDILGFKNRAQGCLNQLRVNEKKISGTNIGDHVLEVQVMQSNWVKTTVEMIDRVVDSLLNFLGMESAGSGCQLCGSEFSVASFNVNGSPHFLCPNCAQASVNQMEAERQNKISEKSNPALGVIGALIGSLLGVAAWIAIGQAGFIAGIAGVLIVMGAMKGYSMLGKSLDKKGVIICVVISLIMVFVATDLSAKISVFLAFKKTGMHITFTELNHNWKKFMDRADLWGSYISNLVVGYLLAVWAGFSSVKAAFHNAGGDYSMKKI